MKLSDLNPPPYTTRVEMGELEVHELSESGYVADVPVADVLYPGEQAEVELALGPGHGEYWITIQPAPGIHAALRRLQFRLRVWRGKP